MADRLDLVLVWHMHQPDYRDHAGGGRFVLPWTYLHALKDYTDMAAHLERHPGVRAVVNFVPTLTDQLGDYARQFCDGSFRDLLPELLVRPDLNTLTEDERKLLRTRCFQSNHLTMLKPFNGYARLHSLLRHLSADGERPLAYLSGQYYADLVTWYHLAWIGETERRRPEVAALLARSECFGMEDRRALATTCCELLCGLIARYRKLGASGQVELSTTPYAHPLAPLLIDFASAREVLPDLPLPRAAAYPGGKARVARHIARALDHHRDTFGAAPAGMWPAEGAVSAPVLRELAAAGLRWTASSQSVLANSLKRAGGQGPSARELYQPWQLPGAGGLSVFFRDERLSDLIGFEYARWHGRDAAEHFIAQLETIAREAPANESPLVSVILDGENAWEHYPYNGYYFFEELYGRLAQHPVIRSTTYGEWLERNPGRARTLPGLAAGSWVHGTLTTWVGDKDKNRGWDLLCAAKQAYDDCTGALPECAAAAAETQLKVCESSDWFWWLGDYNPAEAVASFEHLYRDNLARLYRLIGREAPAELAQPLSRGAGAPDGGGTMRRAG